MKQLLSASGTRRDFLVRGGGAASLILLGTLPARRGDATVRTRQYPFTLGVASGDPAPDGVVLWTRLAPDPLRRGGGMPAQRVRVGWEIARDEHFRRIVQRGEALAVPELAHSVHVEARGLAPDHVYWYRFLAGGEASPAGRTRTAPAPGARVDRLALAFASCQSYQAGYYTAHRHLAGEDLNLVVFLGDYIYEGGISENAVRRHSGPEIVSLDDYRARYALYKSDADLQAAHAAFPWVVTWDDHEVDNNYADSISQDRDPVDVFLERRAAAYQAYYEHMPLRRSSMPRGPDLRLYRRLAFGDLLELNMLDTRQYRTDQPCGDGIRIGCEAAHSPDASILGAAQESWLLGGLGASAARWNVLGNQLPLAQIDRVAGPEQGYHMDQWSGYTRSRDRLLDFLRERRVANPVVITGDVHQSWVAELKADWRDASSATLGTEFVGTSISSGGDGQEMTRSGEGILADNPHVKFYNARRGYVRCTVTPDSWESDYLVVPQISLPEAPLERRASFLIEAGRPGVQPA